MFNRLSGRYGAVYGNVALAAPRRLGEQTFQSTRRKAIDAPGPGDGQIIRTSLPDTFDGIRFEIGRMAKCVAEARRDPVVIDCTRMAVAQWSRIVAQLSEQEGNPVDVHNNKTIALEAIDIWCRAHFCYVNDPAGIEMLQTPRRMIKMTKVSREILAHFMEPFYRALEAENPSFDRRSIEPAPVFAGDCVPFSQKIIVRDRSDHSYGIKEIGELEKRWKYYHVVSYNEKERRSEFKPITHFIDKGCLPVYKVTLSNGSSFRCTENHKLYAFKRYQYDYQTEYELVVMTLGELRAARAGSQSDHYTLATAVRIPEALLSSRYTPELSNAQLFVEGLYVAEGWAENSGKGKHKKESKIPTKRAKIGMNNAHAITALKTNLAVMGQEYGEHVRQDGLITVRMNVSKFTTRLGRFFGKSSAEKRFPDWYSSMSRDQLTTLLSAYALGDGYIPTHGQWKDWAKLVYNTKSEKLARQLQFMHLILGRPVSFYRQPAWKEKPAMYRLYEYIGGAKEKCPGLGSSRIKSIEPDGEERCCDITVAGNHNFMLEGGALVHNCDEAALVVCGMAASIDITPVAFAFGGDGGTLHHTWAKAQADGTWYDSDITDPTFQLGDRSLFEQEEEYEVPL